MSENSFFINCQAQLDRLRSELDANCAMISTIVDGKHTVHHISEKNPPPEGISQIAFEHSICGHVQKMNFPLLVDDAQSHPLLKNNPLIPLFSIGSYAGYPIPHPTTTDEPIGIICVIHDRLHNWSSDEQDRIESVAISLGGEMKRENILTWFDPFSDQG